MKEFRNLEEKKQTGPKLAEICINSSYLTFVKFKKSTVLHVRIEASRQSPQGYMAVRRIYLTLYAKLNN